MYLLKYDRSEEINQITQQWGGYNHFPPFWKDVTEHPDQIEMVKRNLLDLDFYAAETRQMYYPEEHKYNGCYVGATLFFTRSNNGFAIAKVYNRNSFKFEDRYFVFGCRHINCLGTTLGRCYYGYTCQDCGHHWTVDSSD